MHIINNAVEVTLSYRFSRACRKYPVSQKGTMTLQSKFCCKRKTTIFLQRTQSNIKDRHSIILLLI